MALCVRGVSRISGNISAFSSELSTFLTAHFTTKSGFRFKSPWRAENKLGECQRNHGINTSSCFAALPTGRRMFFSRCIVPKLMRVRRRLHLHKFTSHCVAANRLSAVFFSPGAESRPGDCIRCGSIGCVA